MKTLNVFLAIILCLGAATASYRGGRQASQVSPENTISEPDPAWASSTLSKLSLRDKVAQLIQVRAGGRFIHRNSESFRDLADAVRRNHVGGIILFAGDVYESAVLLNDLQQISDLPLLVSADFERGASFRITDTTSFPWNMAIGATGSEELSYREGAVTAREARALGVHWIYAPVVDVNNNPDNPVINIRSYGEDPQLVAHLGSAFIRGARDHGVLTTAKHFPGHGDTATDSHIGLAVIPADRERLDAVELAPFRSAIDAGVDAIMTAHIAVPQVTGQAGLPATLSPQILTTLLRGELHFPGLVVTDALEMGGITSHYWTGLACIRALQAGTDVLLLPQDTDVAINEVVRAVERGEIAESRIDESVMRILLAKTRLGLHRMRTVAIEGIEEAVSAPESQQLAQEMSDRSITVLKDRTHLLPLNPLNPPKIYALVLSSEPDLNPAATFQSELKRRFPAARVDAADTRFTDDMAARFVQGAASADIIICASLVKLVTGKGSIAIPANQRAVIEKITALRKPIIWIAFGNPYLFQLYPEVSAYMCTFGYSEGAYLAAAKALAGEIQISGKTPVSIPGHFKIGEGLDIPPLDMKLKPAPAGDKDRFEETRRLLASFVDAGAFPGATLTVGYQGSLVLNATAGKLDYSGSSPAATSETIYDLASVSKVVGTTSAAMMLAESGRLLLDAPVQDYLPEFIGKDKERVKVIQLLQHTGGLPAWSALYKEAEGYNRILQKIYAMPLEYAPGSRSVYSDLGMILLGEVITRACGHPLDEFLTERLFAPLGMFSTRYRPPATLREKIAPTENDPWRGRVIRGEVHDENASAMGGVAGHAGIFSTSEDLSIFAQMMLNRGMYDHRRYFKSETVDRFTGAKENLGWQKPSASDWTGKVFSPSAYGHNGFTGVSIWIDPARQLFVILLTNRIHPSRENNLIGEARQKITESAVRIVDRLGK
jgi:beta-glucosidase-like glycosyl hydrolase/CubicO group peptidase (beta-lactamase class C family)